MLAAQMVSVHWTATGATHETTKVLFQEKS
jgi:hypothetical protein